MMISSRTPLRVSFFGGGTDYPEYFQRHRGAVVGMALDKYIYISALPLNNFLEYKYRLSYSRLEKVQRIEDIQHPVVRSVLSYHKIEDALDISVLSDLPARSGLGSSSSFTVGLINLVNTMRSICMTKLDLGLQAIFVERELLKERVGVQDQLHAAFGGINRFDFENGRTRISPIQMTSECQRALTQSLVLLYSGATRYASETLDEQLSATVEKKLDHDLSHLLALTDQAVNILEGSQPEAMIREFGALMHEGWMIKRGLSKRISNQDIDGLYDLARQHGALGGKLCGAGSGGFLLMVIPPECRKTLAKAVAPIRIINVGLDTLGSTILHG